MKSVVSHEVFVMFPEYIRGVVIARSINNRGENKRLIGMLREAEKAATQDTSLQDIKNHTRIACWRQAYQKFGVNPNKFYSSIESLCRRARRGDTLPYINTAVALFNYFSLKHIVPSGGDDLKNVDGDLRLTLAAGNEPFTPFNSDKVETPAPGEIIYIDNRSVMCRCWNWRQGDQTKLSEDTKDIAINIDCLPPVGRDEAEMITAELAGLVGELCGGEVRYGFITADQAEYEL